MSFNFNIDTGGNAIDFGDLNQDLYATTVHASAAIEQAFIFEGGSAGANDKCNGICYNCITRKCNRFW